MSTLRSYFSTSTPLPVRRLLPMPSDLALPDHSHIYTCFLTFILFLSASFSLAFQIYVFFLVESILVFVFSKSNRQNSVYFSISGDWILFRCMCVRSVPAPNTKFHLAIRPNDDHLRYATQHTPTKTRRHPRNLILLLCITFIFSCCAYVFVK